MANASHASRLVAAGVASSVICAAAGIIAFTGQRALRVSSALLVLSIVVAIVGYAYAENRKLGWGAMLIVAATLPLFGLLYAIGAVLMGQLGPLVAGGLLVLLSVVGVLGTFVLLRRIGPNSARRAPTGR